MHTALIYTLEKLAFILFILLIPFQDSGLQQISKFLGARLSNFPLMILIILVSIKLIFIKKSIPRKAFFFFMTVFLYILILGLIPILFFYGDLFYASYLYRSLFVNMAIIATKIFILCYIVKNYGQCYDRYVVLAFIITWFGYLTCDVFDINFGSLIHLSTSEFSGRSRGFSPEPSMLGTTVVILGILSSYTQKTMLYKNLFIILTALLLVLSTSKGAIGVMLILVYILSLKSRIHIILKLLSSLIAIAGFIYLWNNFIVFLLGLGSEDLFGTGSVTTRCSAILTSVMIVKDFPFGTGPSAVFGIEFIKHIPAVYSYLSDFVGGYGLDPTEIFSMIHNNVTDKEANIGSKSGFFNNLAYFGLPFMVYFIYIVNRVQKDLLLNREFLLWMLFLFIVLAIVFYTDVNYDSILGFGIVLSYYYKHNPNAICFKWMIP